MIQITDSMLGAFASASLYSKEGKGFEATVIAKFFMPFTSAVWLVTEAERQEDGDWIFFGYCHILEWEWGYFTLSEIAELEFHGITAEVDCELPEGQTVDDCLKSLFVRDESIVVKFKM